MVATCTPFPVLILRRRLRLVESLGRRERGVQVLTEAPKGARVQGLLSRGGRAVAAALETVARGGPWRTALQGELARRVLDQPWDPAAPLPWSFVGATPHPDHLRSQALAGAALAPCRPGTCRACGVCRETGDGQTGAKGML